MVGKPVAGIMGNVFTVPAGERIEATMYQALVSLWKGDMPLGRAFWEYAMIYGTLVNAVATAASFVVLATGAPGWLAVAVFLLPLPYVVAATVGVWRSADRYRGPPQRANWARVAVAVWAVAVVLL